MIELTASANLWDEPAIASLVNVLHTGAFHYYSIDLMLSSFRHLNILLLFNYIVGYIIV